VGTIRTHQQASLKRTMKALQSRSIQWNKWNMLAFKQFTHTESRFGSKLNYGENN